MTPNQFNHLLDELRNGNNNALEPIYKEYYGKLTYTAMQVLRNYSEATDIASDVMLYILKNASAIGHIDHPNAWMRQVAKNSAVDFVRRDSKIVLTDTLSRYDKPGVPCNTTLYVDITSAVQALPQDKQDLFELHYIYGYKYKELSSMLHMPVGTIKRQIHEIKSALVALKEYL